MKNWRFLQVGNADPKVTDISGKDGSGVVERMSNLFFVSYKLNNGEKGIEKFPTEAQAVDFLKKKVGNETIGPNWDKKRQLEDELRGWMTMVNKLDGDERRNAEKQIADIRKELNDVKIKIAHGENKKAGNESIDKQEWSLFNGLRKDAEKEVGNSTGDEYNAEIQRLTKKAEQLRRMGQGRSAMEIEKQIEKLGKELHELGNKKTGNRTIRTEKKGDWVVVYINGWKAGAGKAEYKGSVLGWQTDGNTYGMTPSGMISSSAFRKTYRTEPTDKQIEKDLIEDFWIHHNDKETMEKIGNNKVGNTAHSDKVEVIKKLIAGGWSVEDIYKMLKTEGYEVEKSFIERLKTGNAIPGSIASIGPAWMYGGTVYGKMDTDESGKKHNEYVKITWLGSGKGGVANYFIDDKMQSDKLGSLDKNELKRWAESKVGNETKEADKVDNLKRARNAMAKNSQVTLWNGNDTALISEDGTVQYLESNSFEVDRDKYDSQEKAIEELTKKGYRKK